MKKILFIVTLLVIFTTIIYQSFDFDFKKDSTHLYVKNSNNFFVKILKKIIPQEIKKIAKDTIFVFKKVSLLEDKVKEKDIFIRELLNDQKSFIFSIDKNKINKTKLGDVKVRLKKYTSNSFAEIRSRSYLDLYKKNLFLVSGEGVLSYASFEDITDEKLNFSVVNSNLSQIINGENSVKNLLVKNNKIYVSYVKELNNECFTNAILVGKINFGKIIFKEFLVLDGCEENLDHQSGGNLADFKDNKILMSIGDYSNYERINRVQKLDNHIGKIISIDENTKKYKILSIGHRNSQGLYYDKQENIIYSTDHGPQGGDEINLNTSPDDEIKNYGWPISSYGEHYGFPDTDNSKLYALAPLKKSHSKYGFIEPLFYFDPSIGITQIIKTDKFIRIPNKKIIYVTSLGYDIKEGDLSIHQFIIQNDSTVEKHNILPVNERIRDIIYIQELDKMFMTLDSSGSIGVLEIDD